jgi:hypothetical protein
MGVFSSVEMAFSTAFLVEYNAAIPQTLSE